MPAPEPPPVKPPTGRPLQFNTATLLGLMALVAVVSAMAMTAPWIFPLVCTLVATAAMVAYAGFLAAGILRGGGDKRVFAIAALVCFLVSFWTQTVGNASLQLLMRGRSAGPIASFFWALLAPIEHISFSLFGGWVALRTAKFWQVESGDDAS